MRIAGRGVIDRSRPVRFRFNGQPMEGFHGDTLASALLANGVRLVGRSFKYHRPRGIMTAGAEEPNALVTIGTGATQTPNLRAPELELAGGLDARSQNAWPSLRFDAMAGNDLVAPFLSAGFYYKTFMWPRAFWERLYEPVIRRAAGLGALSGQADTTHYDKAWAHCDLLVIGAGPTGLMAAVTAARAGVDVILTEADTRCGGRLLAEVEEVDGQSGPDWVAGIIAELESMPNVRLMPRTTVVGAYDQGTYGALQKSVPDQSEQAPSQTFWRIVAQRAVMATGALERPVAFADNDRPGIMMAGAVRAYLNRWGVAPGRSVTVFANNDSAHRTARDLVEAGVNVAALIDVRPDAQVSGDYPVYTGARVVGTRGRLGLNRIRVTDGTRDFDIQSDCLAISGGWNPALHLSCHMGARPVWNDAIAAFVPAENSVPGLLPAGAAAGHFSTGACLRDGIRAANDGLEHFGKARQSRDAPKAEQTCYAISPLWEVEGKGRAWLDFQNDVTTKDVRQAAQENFRSVEHMKRYTTQGMATDQGKLSNIGALAVLADATGRTIPETGTTTFRPPFTPVGIGVLGAGGLGQAYAPRRFTTSHAASVARGAPMIEAGLWYRPSYFPLPGEQTWRESCDREVGYVRNAVGICDVSTLGKIDIQGPDAAPFLDFVYANTMSTLKVGRVRYGLMLREDGHVMDDGTCARLAHDHFLITTTTAAAGAVMKHLDFVHQALRPDLDLARISVTEQWAQFAVAGPKSRDLLNNLLDDRIDDALCPFMACGDVSVGGVAGRLFRISFSGEHAYELAVPAHYGDSLFRLLVGQAETLGGGAYGMEALNVLRIEKGFITHAEIHGRVTADDVGMGRMVAQNKDCIGKTGSQRPGLVKAGREQLVGLRPLEAAGRLSAGAHLFNEGEAARRVNDQGYVTSVCHSPTSGHALGLGFLRNGRSRMGETIVLVDHLRGLRTPCHVADPVVFDPDGGRVRG